MALLAHGRSFCLRAAAAAVAVGTALGLAGSPALAVVAPFSNGADALTIETDDAADVVSTACVADQTVVSGSPAAPALACGALKSVVVDGADGANTVDLGGLTLAAFPHLSRTSVDVEDEDADAVTGSVARDLVHADNRDDVVLGPGDDWVENAGTADGGDGNDTFRNVAGAVSGGAGDDLIVNPGAGPYDGGSGFDTVDIDYSSFTPELTLNLTFTDTAVNGAVPTSSIEAYDVTATDGARADLVNSRSYSGRVTFHGRAGDDTFLGGPGADVADLGAGNDVADPGPGSDLVLAGDGDDTISARDGFGDVIDCGPGTDTVTADRSDVLSGCENVSLPAPETSRIAGPTKLTKGEKAFYTFATNVLSATFECQVDSGPFKGCTSPLTLKARKLKPGRHTLTVRAVQPATNADPTPSTLAIKVKPRPRAKPH